MCATQVFFQQWEQIELSRRVLDLANMVDEVESHSAAVDIATAVWAGELSCSRRTPRRSFPRRLLFNASRNLCSSLA